MCAICVVAIGMARHDLKETLRVRYGLTTEDMADYLHDPEGSIPHLQRKACDRE